MPIRIALYTLLLWQFALTIGAARETPNVVFIYIDDLGYSDVGFLDAAHYRTPAIDALASRGMIFTNAYAAAPNCAPSRACLMSGQYSPRHGIYTVNNSDRGKSEHRKLIPIPNKTILPASKQTLGELFQHAGYETAYFGKWHLGQPGSTGPSEQGFELNVGGNHTGTPRGGHFSPYQNPQLADPPEREYLTDRLTQETIQFIRANQEKPFFAFLSHYAVHTPIQAKKDITARYQDGAKRDGFNAKYAAMVASVDESVGAIVNTLDELKLTHDTIVIFYSDNGGHGKVTSCAPLRGAKGMAYEGGIRVPLTVCWPNQIAASSASNVPVTGVDFFETFRVLLEQKRPPDQVLDGVDIMPLLTGKVSVLDRALYWHFPAYLQGQNYDGAPDPHFRARPFGAIRSGKWKLIESFEEGTLELYDLENDLGETTNLAESQPVITRQLSHRLREWRTETQAPVPTQPNPEYRSK